MLDPEKVLERFGLEPGQRVADLGVGSGFYTLAAARLVGEEGGVVAIDVQKELLEKVAHTAEEASVMNAVEVLWGNTELEGGTRLRDDAVDAAIVSNTLFQIDDKPGLAREVARIVKAGGRLLVVDWTDSHGGLGPPADHIVPKEKAQELFSLAGFSHQYDIDAGEHHYAFVAKKEE